MIGIICKICAAVLFILDIIGSAIISYVPAEHWTDNADFIWTTFFTGVVSGFIVCLIIYVLGEIVDQLYISNANTHELYKLLKKNDHYDNPPEEKESYFNSFSTSFPPAEGDGWVCKKCGSNNNKSALYCKDCGTYK